MKRGAVVTVLWANLSRLSRSEPNKILANNKDYEASIGRDSTGEAVEVGKFGQNRATSLTHPNDHSCRRGSISWLLDLQPSPA